MRLSATHKGYMSYVSCSCRSGRHLLLHLHGYDMLQCIDVSYGDNTRITVYLVFTRSNLGLQ